MTPSTGYIHKNPVWNTGVRLVLTKNVALVGKDSEQIPLLKKKKSTPPTLYLVNKLVHYNYN